MPKPAKLTFIERRKIDFIDLISEIEVEPGEEANYYDGYIDGKVSQWRDVIEEIQKLHSLKRICFTRKTFSDIPKMKLEIDKIQLFCKNRGIIFRLLPTPARFYNDEKQSEWTNFLNNDI